MRIIHAAKTTRLSTQPPASQLRRRGPVRLTIVIDL
jgi:hypothetical protein